MNAQEEGLSRHFMPKVSLEAVIVENSRTKLEDSRDKKKTTHPDITLPLLILSSHSNNHEKYLSRSMTFSKTI